MKQKFKAYASWLRMFEDEFPFKSSGKLATLWFDEIILQIPNKKYIVDVTENVAQEQDWGTTTLKELQRLWVPVTKYQPEYRLLSGHPWESNNKDLVKTAWKVTVEETKKMVPNIPNPENERGFYHEVAWAGAGLIESVNLWMALNTQNNCSFLPESREHMILQELFSFANRKKPFDIFSEIFIHKIPDLSSFSWDDVVELRHHTFFSEFRRKMEDLQRILDSGDSRSVQQLVEDISRMDMERAFRSFQPSPIKSLIKTIASNFPLMIPINPISLVLNGRKIKRELDFSRKYGWLYFLFDLDRKH